jgi:hypothetical protein
MTYSKIPSLRIAGSGNTVIPGYGSLKIAGFGSLGPEELNMRGCINLPGGLKVRDLKSSGSINIDGDITVDSVKIRGSIHVHGDLKCKELSKSGSLKVTNDLIANVASVSGSTKVSGKGSFEKKLDSKGSIILGDDLVSGGSIWYSGTMRVDGKLESKTFDARLGQDDSNIRDGIKAERIEVRVDKPNNRYNGYLITSDIVGDDIVLENVICNNVEGNKVKILRGCHIKEKVRFRDKVSIDPYSKLNREPEQI